MKKKYIRRSFKREILVSFLLLSIFPLLISNTALVRIFKTMLTKQEQKEVETQFQAIHDTFLLQMQEMDAISQSLSKDTLLQEHLRDEDRWMQNRIYTMLYGRTESIRDCATISIYDAEGKLRYTTQTETVSQTIPVYWGGARVAQQNNGELAVVRNGSSLQAIRAIQQTEHSENGYVVIEMNKSDFETLFKDVNYGDSEIVLLDSHWEEIYGSREADYQGFSQNLRNNKIYSRAALAIKDMAFKVDEIKNLGISIAICRSTSFTPAMMRLLIIIIFIMTVICLVFCFVLAEYLTNNLSTPVNKLSYAMKEVEGGNLDIRIDCEREDELGALTRNFNKMTRELKEYMELQVQNQKELNDANVAMMQAQLNPHFLYNTLDTIKWIAKANQVNEIVSLSSSLARILRTSISGEAFIPLSKEIELVESYVDIQKIRFSGKFHFDVEMPMEYEDFLIPKLVIQPIVENAIIHGLRECEEGYILLNIFERDGCLVIEISDDGKGMDEIILEALNSRKKELLKGHIGFYNVDMILCLYYGEEYGLHAENKKGGGVKVSMRIPRREA